MRRFLLKVALMVPILGACAAYQPPVGLDPSQIATVRFVTGRIDLSNWGLDVIPLKVDVYDLNHECPGLSTGVASSAYKGALKGITANAQQEFVVPAGHWIFLFTGASEYFIFSSVDTYVRAGWVPKPQHVYEIRYHVPGREERQRSLMTATDLTSGGAVKLVSLDECTPQEAR